MTCVLAIDTTTDVCSVALLRGSPASRDGCLEHTRKLPKLHNQHVLAMIDRLFRAADAAKRDVDLVAFGAGPGSFTGVRIGAAIAQGFTFGVGAEVLPVASSAVLAEAARQSGMRGTLIVCRPSRRGWHYQARYRITAEAVASVQFDTSQPDSEAPRTNFVDGRRHAVSARIVGELALRGTEQPLALALALPFYVEGDTPWKPSVQAD